MKRLLLLFSAILFSLFTIQAQNVIWEEDFSDGMRGWATRTDQCGKNFGGILGSYGLTTITVNGSAVPGVTAELNMMNALEYNVRFDDGTNYGTVYARYSIANNVMNSNLNAAAVPLSGRSTTVDNAGYLTTSTSMEVSQAAFDAWVSTITGINDPMVTLSGSIITMTSGNTVITFTNKNVCAGLWMYSADGSYGTRFTEATIIGSETADNGFVFFNAVMQSWLENDANLNVPPSEYPEYTTSIISPDIDISSAANALSLEFTQAVLYLNLSSGAPAIPISETVSRQVRTAFEVSTDGGANWSAPIELNEGLESNTWIESRESIPIPSEVIGSATSIKLRITFGSDFYFWGLDDIAVVERLAYDMRVNDNFYAVYPNFATPISQADSAAFLADIQNIGGLDATNVKLNLTITSDNDGTVVYNDTRDYGTIIVDSIAENQLFDEILDPSGLNNGFYTGTYLISHDNEDGNTLNDTLQFSFLMTDTLFAKENGIGARGVSPADDVSYSFGNVFYCPKGEGYVARYMSFGVSNPDELAGRSVNTYLYEWAGDANNDGRANSSEYGNALGINSYTFTGTEEGLIKIPFDFEGAEIPLKNNTHYIALVQYINSADNQDCQIAVSENIDYSAMVFANALAGMPREAPVLWVGPEPSPDLILGTFAGGAIPIVRMSIGNTVNAPQVLSPDNKIKVYPNPTSDVVNLEVALVQTSNKVQITIIDGAGRILQRNAYQNFKEGKFDYNLSNLTNGLYFIRVQTDEGIKTEKVFLQR